MSGLNLQESEVQNLIYYFQLVTVRSFTNSILINTQTKYNKNNSPKEKKGICRGFQYPDWLHDNPFAKKKMLTLIKINRGLLRIMSNRL